MKIVINVENQNGTLVVTTTVPGSGIKANHVMEIAAETLGESLAPVLQRIFDRRTSIVVIPEGMKLVPAGIVWMAFSEVAVAVPLDTPDDGDEHREAVRLAIKRDGLPEVV